MLELLPELLGEEEAYVVGGTIRDELLGREGSLDVDVVCADPERGARALARRTGGSPFPLSVQHGGWRVVLPDGRSADFTPIREGRIDADLAARDFTVNAMARPVGGGELLDLHGGQEDLAAKTIRHVSEHAFDDDPLRLLRAVRFADELGFALAPETEALVRGRAGLVAKPAGERIVEELRHLSPRGFRLLGELGLLAPLGGSVERLRDDTSPAILLVTVFGERLRRYPISSAERGLAAALLRARRPADESPRELHRFRRATEPWALEALEFLGAPELREAVLAARSADPGRPLVRGDELGLEPGPEVGRLLELIAEERAAGTISTREEALELARREQQIRADG